MSRKVLYYAVGPVHPRNVRLIAEGLPQLDFCMLYEADAWWMTPSLIKTFPYEALAFAATQVPESLDPTEIMAVVFSTVQPRPAPLSLFQWCIEHDIVSIAIGESNQISLNGGTVNNYLMPVDHLLVASQAEKRGHIEAGIAEDRIQVTGWPFYDGPESVSSNERRDAKIKLGIDPEVPVAALTLTAFNDAGETDQVRRRQLELAYRGLPPGYKLAIKPHPIEKMEVLMPFVRELAKDAVVLPGEMPVGDLLRSADVLLNRGVSQVAIEALMQKLPVVVLETGKRTPFHSTTSGVVAATPTEVREKIEELVTGNWSAGVYERFLADNAPYCPSISRRKTCEVVAGIVGRGRLERDRASEWLQLALVWAWQKDSDSALDAIKHITASLRAESDALCGLMEARATRGNLDLLLAFFRGNYFIGVVTSLWVVQLEQTRQEIDAKDVELMQSFPPAVNSHLFFAAWGRWMRYLIRCGYDSVAAESIAGFTDDHGGDRIAAKLVRDLSDYQSGGWRRLKSQARYAWRSGKEFGKGIKKKWA
jgi:hypothetical protein